MDSLGSLGRCSLLPRSRFQCSLVRCRMDSSSLAGKDPCTGASRRTDLAIARQFVTPFCRPLGLVSSLRLYSGSRAFFLLVSYSLSSQLAFSGLLSAGCDRVPESDKATEEPVDLALLPDCHYR